MKIVFIYVEQMNMFQFHPGPLFLAQAATATYRFPVIHDTLAHDTVHVIHF